MPTTRRSRRVRLALLLGLLIAGALGVVWLARHHPLRFEREIRAFEAEDERHGWPADAVLFVGSSSIRKWPLEDSFARYRTIHRGFGGCFLSDVDYFADRIVFPYRPRAIVLYAGENDVADGTSAQAVFEIYGRFAQRVHAQLPETQLVFLSIKPAPVRWDLWPEVQRANRLIEAHAADHPRQHYVDTASPMLGPDGAPKPSLFAPDGLHLSAAGYRLWTALVKTQLGPPMDAEAE